LPYERVTGYVMPVETVVRVVESSELMRVIGAVVAIVSTYRDTFDCPKKYVKDLRLRGLTRSLQ